MQIAGFLKTSLVEWPGKISSVIFVPGCNFRCPFCHNAELIVRNKDIKLQSFTEERIFADLKKRKEWIEAAVITGGEPTLQKDLPVFLKKIKEMNLLAMVETNGTNPLMIAFLVKNKLVDFFSMDLKGNFENYEKYTSISEKLKAKSVKLGLKVQKSLELIAGSGIEYEFRTTVVPGLHDLKNLQQLANGIDKIFSDYKYQISNCRWYLQQFRPINTLDKKFLNLKPFSTKEIENLQKTLQQTVPQTLLRGV